MTPKDAAHICYLDTLTNTYKEPANFLAAYKDDPILGRVVRVASILGLTT